MKKIEEAGNRYGKLVVVEEAGKTRQGQYWRCLCNCGKIVTVCGSRLRNGNTTSCGCSRARSHALANFNDLYRHQYRKKAEARGLSFELTEEDFSFITKMNCFYCGCEPAQIRHMKGCNGAYIFNGIDRIDSGKGYTIDNVVPCCKTCNYMKRDMTVPEFKQRVLRIAEYRNWEGRNNAYKRTGFTGYFGAD